MKRATWPDPSPRRFPFAASPDVARRIQAGLLTFFSYDRLPISVKTVACVAKLQQKSKKMVQY